MIMKRNSLTVKSALFAAIMALSAGYSTPSMAEGLTAEGAKALKAEIQKLLDNQASIARANGDTYMWDGDLSVEPAGKYFAVTLPYLKIQHIDGSKTDIGMVAANAAPGKGEGQWKMAIALPTPIRKYNNVGDLNVQIDFGKQRIAGLFYQKYSQLIKLDSAVEDIKVKNAEGQELAFISNISMKQDFQLADSSIGDGDYDFSISDLKVTIPEENVTISFDKASMIGDGKGIDMNASKEFQDKMAEIGAKNKEAMDSADAVKNMSAVSSALFDYIGDFGDSSTGRFSVKDFKITFPNENDASKMQTVHVDEVAFDMSLKKMREELSDFGIGLSILGIHVPNFLEGQADTKSFELVKPLTPKDISYDTSLINFPLAEVMKILGENASFMIDPNADPFQAQQDMAQIGPQLIGLIMQAGTSVKAEKTYFKSDLYNIDFKVDMKADASSPLQAVGTVLVTAEGLKDTIDHMQKIIESNEDPMLSMMMQQGLGGLSMVQLYGQHKEVNGKTAHVYNFEFKEDGQMLLNGTDLMQIVGAFMGGGMPR